MKKTADLFGTVEAGFTSAGLVPRQNARSAAERFAEMPGTRGDPLPRLLDSEQRDDGDVLREVLRALMLDTLVPLTVAAQVQDGIVTLTGTVSRPGDRDDVQLIVACVPGVLGITDRITLIPAPEEDGGDVEADLGAALGRTEIDAGELSVDIPWDSAVAT